MKKYYQTVGMVYPLIVTRNMATIVESSLNNLVEADAFLQHYHLSYELTKSLANKVLKPYNKKCAKGITVLVKELEGQFSYQFVTQNVLEKASYSRVTGRYLVYKKALELGMTPVDKTLTEGLSTEEAHIAVLNLVVDLVNKLPEVKEEFKTIPEGYLKISGFDFLVQKETVENKEFITPFELLVQEVIPTPVSLEYSYNEETEETSLTITPVELTEENKQYKCTVVVKRSPEDENLEYLAKYYALFKLFKKVT